MGQYEDFIADDSGFSLDDALDAAERHFRDDFLEYWGLEADECPEHLDPDQWLECRKIYGLAKQISDAATSLLHKKGLGRDRLALPQIWQGDGRAFQHRIDELLQAVKEQQPEDWFRVYQLLLPSAPSDPRTKYNIFCNVLQLEAARLFPIWPGKIANRLQVLIGYLVRSPNDRSASYLSRVAACYALGMSTEFAVMARAVLDSALEDFVDDEIVVATVGQGRRGHVGLERRIEYCIAKNVFDQTTAAAATRIREAGDNAVHTAPGLEPDLESLLAALARTLSSIEAAKNPT